MMLTGRQEVIFNEAYEAYINLDKLCVEFGERVIRPGKLENMTHAAIFNLQLQKLLLDLSEQYETALSAHEVDFFQSLARESSEELEGAVSGYRRFFRKVDRESFDNLDPDFFKNIGDTPWCIKIALQLDKGRADEYTSYCLQDFITIVDAFLCLDNEKRSRKSEIIDEYFSSLMLSVAKVNPNCKEVNNQNILDRMWYIKEPNAEKKEEEKTLEELIAELHEMIGLQGVKDNVDQMIKVLRVQNEMKRRGYPETSMSLHMVFTGNPGTGKTTIARLLAKIYKKMGVLSKGQLVEADRSSLVAGYIGQSELKTKEVINSAMGGILFIDEAYALTDGQGSNDYGHEVISTLLKAMEDHRDALVVIVAGYPEKMSSFLKSNPGLQSRFNTTIHFDDYTPDEMLQIFKYTCRKNGYVPTRGCINQAEIKIRNHCRAKTEFFANGRDMRNYFEKIVRKQNMRIADMSLELKDIDDDTLTLLTSEDVEGVEI